MCSGICGMSSCWAYTWLVTYFMKTWIVKLGQTVSKGNTVNFSFNVLSKLIMFPFLMLTARSPTWKNGVTKSLDPHGDATCELFPLMVSVAKCWIEDCPAWVLTLEEVNWLMCMIYAGNVALTQWPDLLSPNIMRPNLTYLLSTTTYIRHERFPCDNLIS